jgi:23S rRNA-/tRNA-specific pseudouridylate synthase
VVGAEGNLLFEDNHLLIINKPAACSYRATPPATVPLSNKAEEYLRFKKPGAAFIM